MFRKVGIGGALHVSRTKVEMLEIRASNKVHDVCHWSLAPNCTPLKYWHPFKSGHRIKHVIYLIDVEIAHHLNIRLPKGFGSSSTNKFWTLSYNYLHVKFKQSMLWCAYEISAKIKGWSASHSSQFTFCIIPLTLSVFVCVCIETPFDCCWES